MYKYDNESIKTCIRTRTIKSGNELRYLMNNKEKQQVTKQLIISENCCNSIQGDLVIANYPHLDKIVVKKNSLKNLNSLEIVNNTKLNTIEIEDGILDISWENNAFNNVKNVVIKSKRVFLL